MSTNGTDAITVRYFASVREGIGMGEETVSLPDDVDTIEAFVGWLRSRGPLYDAALAPDLRIRAAIDQVHAAPETPIKGAREIALFPMMTGG